MASTKQIYKRSNILLQIGQRWNVNAELQIMFLNGTHNWFTDHEFNVVNEAIYQSCYDRVIMKCDKTKDYIIKDDLVIVFEFLKIPGKSRNITLLRLPDKFANTDVPKTKYGKYKLLPMYKEEKLIITVSLKEQVPEELHKNKSIMNQSIPVISTYFPKKTLKETEEKNQNVEACEEKKEKGLKGIAARIKQKKEETKINGDKNTSCVSIVMGQPGNPEINTSPVYKGKENKCQDGNVKNKNKTKTSKKKSSKADTAPGPSDEPEMSPECKGSGIVAEDDFSKSKNDTNFFEDKLSKTADDKNRKRKRTTRSNKNKDLSILDLATQEENQKGSEEGENNDSDKEFDDKQKFSKPPAIKKGRKRRQRITMPSKNKRGKKATNNEEPITSLDELIKSKESDHDIREMEDIPSLHVDEENETVIDLEEYGKVTLKEGGKLVDVSSVQIRDLVRSMEDDLKAIFKGKVYCERHQQYKRGGHDRERLTMQVRYGAFKEEQVEALTKVLMDIFCGKKSTYFDYVMKVILPETMMMLHQKITGDTREQTEAVFSV